jgi:hypothetical protein
VRHQQERAAEQRRFGDQRQSGGTIEAAAVARDAGGSK